MGKLDFYDLLDDVILNGLEIFLDQYEVELFVNFDIVLVGICNVKVKVIFIRFIVFLELEILYEVIWGYLIVFKI